jgi:DNA helicase-2/ATP-dependent DNA helicase PcrA
VLGRSVLVRPSQDAPAPWATSDRIQGDRTSLDALQRAHSSRTRTIIEFDGELPDPSPTLRVPLHDLDPDTDLGEERLRHLLTANVVDARDPEHPTFAPISLAVSAGATVSATTADIELPDGTAWCDGGPLDWFGPADTGDVPVIPAVHLESGLLRPSGEVLPQADLAPDQLAAVQHGGGGARIVAPAGSGKTRVLTERARHLIVDRQIDATSICLVAFNVRAREEMQARTTDLPNLEIRTLNSLALAIANGTGGFARPAVRTRQLQMVDERQVRKLIEPMVKTRRAAMTDPLAVWLEAVGAARLRLRAPHLVEEDFGGDVDGLGTVLNGYRAALEKRGALDFTEQIVVAIEILLTDPHARRVARRLCRVLLVDEFQDLAPAHLLLVRLLAGPAANVFGVGDDDQTIYGYTGASPDWLIRFSDFFPGASSHDLQVNYRCPPEVIGKVTNLLSHNRRRVDKTIDARLGRETTKELHATKSDNPITSVVSRVTELTESGVDPTDIAILTRVNATLLAPMIALRQRGLSTNQAVHESFLSRTGVAGALAWIDLATAPDGLLPSSDLAIAARRPPRAISPRVIEWIAEKNDLADISVLADRLREVRDQEKVHGFVTDLEHMRALARRGATTVDLLTAIRDDIGLGGALERKLDASRRSVDRSAHGDDLQALIAIADLQPDPDAFVGWLKTSVMTQPPEGPQVMLATVHKVKGREWPHVIVYDATEGLLPHRLSEDMEEERRLFHVAITRCSESVLIAAGDTPSPFIAELAAPRDPNAPEPEPQPKRAGQQKLVRSGSSPVATDSSPAGVELRERIRTWRLERAKADDVPAFVVFNDRTLDEIVARKPSTAQQLLSVPGIGPAKVRNYGDELIELISAGD